MGIADALEGNQKYAQAILNGHMDELSLSLNPPRARNRQATMTQGSSVMRPGQIWEVNNKDDITFFPPTGATKDGWQEIQYLEASSEKRTGVTNMITQGMPLRSNASRTATGIQAQTAGPTTRLQAIVEHIEDYLIVPMLYKMVTMDSYRSRATGNASLRGMSATGQFTSVSAQSMRAPVKFRIKASSRMLTQQKLQFIAPFLSQYLMNGSFLGQLSKSGQTIDFNEFFNLIQDATGTRSAYKLVRPLTDQEKQAQQTPPPQEVMRQQTAKMGLDSREKIAQIKADAQKEAAAVAATKGDEELALKLLELFTKNDTSLGLAPGQSGTPPGVGGLLGGPSPPQDLQGLQ
jgi:hypothetical protein